MCGQFSAQFSAQSFWTRVNNLQRASSRILPKLFHVKSRPFDFWGEKGYGWFQYKDVLQTDFEGKKFLRGKTWRKKKIPRMKEKYLSWRIKLEKKSYTVACQENNSITKGLWKKILTQTKSPIPSTLLPQKSNGRPLTFWSSNFCATTSQTLIATFVALKIIHRNAFVANVKTPTVCYAYSLSGRR